jgi:hypothetical protein
MCVANAEESDFGYFVVTMMSDRARPPNASFICCSSRHNMNISLTKKKPKKNLGFGLNQRGGTNVFDADESDDDNKAAATSQSSRATVNQAVAQEQEALRKRAAAAALEATSVNSSVYEYDDAYDAMHAKRTQAAHEKQSADAESNKKSLYIQDMLKASQERKFQREIIMERKIAKEQEEESQMADFRGKEEFVTASYKRKLQERQLWLEKEQKQEQKEGTVEKKGMAGFYGGLNTNVALGHQVPVEGKRPSEALVNETSQAVQEHIEDDSTDELGFMTGFERADETASSKTLAQDETAMNESEAVQMLDPNRVKRELIEQKIAEARVRYFKRHNMTDKLSQ